MKLSIEIDLSDELHTMQDVGYLLGQMSSHWIIASKSKDEYVAVDLRLPEEGRLFLMEADADPTGTMSTTVIMRVQVLDEPFASERIVTKPSTTVTDGVATQFSEQA